MTVTAWTSLLVGASFLLYIVIAIRSRATSTGEFYIAGQHVPPLANGMATAADWMSAASFISMAGIISFSGYDGSVYLMGWTGGYVLLALLLAPYLRKFGKYTVPDFIGERYYSQTARLVAVICAIFISFTYVAGQMRGVGVVFSRFLEVDVTYGVIIGMAIVFIYAVLGGMKGITYTQVAQYCVLIFAFMVPAIFISLMVAGTAIPQIGFGSIPDGEEMSLLARLDGLHEQLGFTKYTLGSGNTINLLAITFALMAGTAGLPHVIIRFYTVPSVRAARKSAGWALLFIAILYTTAPAVAVFARTNLIDTVENKSYAEIPDWFRKWEDTDLIAWVDKDGDGRVKYRAGNALDPAKPSFIEGRGVSGERLLSNTPTSNANELYVDRDIMVLANPEIAGLPNWVIALVAAGGLAAALSTAAGLLLVVSTSISHDLLRKWLRPDLSDREELLAARISAGAAVCIAGYLGINPPGYVAEVVAFAFGLAAASFFPAILMGIFLKRMNREGAISGMLVGLIFTASYIIYFRFLHPELDTVENWWWGISTKGIGTVGMCFNFMIAGIVRCFTPDPPDDVIRMVEEIRTPERRAG
jgi:cation/acetate symporter